MLRGAISYVRLADFEGFSDILIGLINTIC